jgi:predicted aldo/keto reductase-like oxidoreductase
MRSCMYAFAYGDPEKAQHALRAWSPADVACTHCTKCDVQCPLGLDVRSGGLEMANLLEGRDAFPG